eukprot:4958523-Alexandrium_andersonii.AAC.1
MGGQRCEALRSRQRVAHADPPVLGLHGRRCWLWPIRGPSRRELGPKCVRCARMCVCACLWLEPPPTRSVHLLANGRADPPATNELEHVCCRGRRPGRPGRRD